MTVTEMLRRISSLELSYWQAYERIEPFGERRADWRMAMIVATLLNVNRNPKSKSKPLQPADILRDMWDYASEEAIDDDPSEAPVWKKHLAITEMWNVALGGKDDRKH